MAKESNSGFYPVGNEMVRGKGELADSNADATLIGDLKDPGGRVEKYGEWFDLATEETSNLRTRMIEDYEFLSNNQYTDAEVAYLKEQKRPTITINFATGIHLSICGIQLRSKTDIKLLPAEPNDAATAPLMEYLVKYVRDSNRINRVNYKVFYNKSGVGMGFWKQSRSFKNRPQGEIKLESVNPLKIIWDPNFPDCEWEDAEWVMHAEYYTMAAAIARWPNKEHLIRQKWGEWLRPASGDGEYVGDTSSSKRSFWDAQTQRAQILEVWYKDIVEADVAVFADGDVEADPDRVKAIEEAAKNTPGSEAGVVITKHPVQRVFVAYVLDDIELQHQESPHAFNEFPFVPSLGHGQWNDRFGVMALMKDAQREKNKRRMAIAEVAGRSARSGIIAEAGVFNREDVERYFNGAGVYLETNVGSSGKWEMVKPPQVDQNLMTLERWATEEIQTTVMLNKEALGQADAGTQSGKAFESKAKVGAISQEALFESFVEEEIQLTKLIIAEIQDMFTPAEAARILGRLAVEDPDNRELAAINGDQLALQELLSRAFNAKYDVVITTKPFEPSASAAKVNSLVELRKAGMMVPDPIMVKAMIEAGYVDKKLGLDWLETLVPQAPQMPAPGQTLPTTPDGADAAQAQMAA